MGRPRFYSLNENYFEKINTPEKAYIVGFIYADGSVYKNYLSICLSMKDIEIIKFIKKELNYGGPYKIKKHRDKEEVSLTISSIKMVLDLKNIGIINNKTYESKNLPRIPKSLIGDMLRGLFDGDGSIYPNRKNNKIVEYTVNFSSNKFILEKIKKLLLIYNISSSNIRYRRKDSIYSGMLDIKGSINIENIYNLMYKEGCFCLLRKKKRFYEFFNIIHNMKHRNLNNTIINQIKEFYLSGMKQCEIYKKLNMPFSSVRGCIQRLRKKGLVT